MRPIAAIALLTLLASSSADALDVGDVRRFRCNEGDCRNGIGTVWDAALGISMHGKFSANATVAGETYVISVPSAPNRKFEVVYGADGLPERGSQPRAIAIQNGFLPVFTGTFGRLEHPFVHAAVAPFAEGVYDTGVGIEYKGQFQFIPAKEPANSNFAAGYYIFFGEMIDHDEDEHATGLYVSERSYPGQPVKFFKASPGYLAEMQTRYQDSLSIARAEIDREARWKSILGVIANIAINSAAGGLGNSLGAGGSPLGGNLLSGGNPLAGAGGGALGGRIAMNLVSSMFSGKDSGMTVGDFTRSVVGAAVADQGTGGAIATALLNGSAGSGGIVNTLGSAVIAQTGSVVGSAIASADGGVGGQVVGAMAQGVFSSLAKGAAGAASPSPTTAPNGSIADNVVGSVGAMAVSRTGSVVGAAIASSDAGVGGQVLGAVTQSVFNGLARGVATSSAPSGTPGTTAATATSQTPAEDPAIKGLQAMSALASAPKPVKEEPVLVPRIPTPPIPPQAPSAYPSPVLSPITRIAYVEKIAPPPETTFASGRPTATNDGLYVRLSAQNGDTLAGKFTTGRGTPARWLSAVIAKKGVGTFDIVSLTDEAVDEFSAEYIDPNGGQYRFGRWNMNNGGIQTNFELDLGARVKHFVPIGRKQTYAARWAIGNNAVFHERMSRTTETKFSATYDEIPVNGIQNDLFVSHEDGVTLFVAGSDLHSVVRISSQKEITRFDLQPFGSGTVNTLIHIHDTLWIGYGSQIIALTGDKLTRFTNISGILPTYAPTFCIAGTDMYLANGEMIQNLATIPSAPRPFLQSGQPPSKPDDIQKLMQLKSAIGAGLYCAEQRGWGPHVYALGPDFASGEERIFKINAEIGG